MSAPLYDGMPPTEREFTVPKPVEGRWGRIICGGTCRDDYARIEIYHQVPGVRYVKLQRAALHSFQAAEQVLGFPILLTGVAWRSCAVQRSLWLSDKARYAHPDVTAHTRGLAIDVDQGQSAVRLAKIHKALIYRHWHQSRPDEPHHLSFGIET